MNNIQNSNKGEKPKFGLGKIKLFNFLKTPVYLKPLFFLLPAFLIDGNGSWLEIWEDCSLVIHIFIAVLLHEMAHAWKAHRYGYKTKEIFIGLFVGGANIDPKFMDNNKHHWRIAFAGPLMNFILAAFFFILGMILVPIFNNNWVIYFIIVGISVNLLLGLANLLPITPLDGSRIFKSLFNIHINKGREENKHKKRTSIWTGSVSLIFSLSLMTLSLIIGDIILFLFTLLFTVISAFQIFYHKESDKK